VKLEEIKTLAQLHSVKVSKMKKTDLVRAIQRAEWNEQCFATGNSASCGQLACAWRDDCQ